MSTNRWVPIENDKPAGSDGGAATSDDYAAFVAANRIKPADKPAAKQPQKQLSLGDVASSAYDSTIGLASKAGRGLASLALDAVRGSEPGKDDATLLDQPTAKAPTQPAPVDREVFTQMKAALGAMPREERLQQAQQPGWRGQVARAAIDQLDQEQQGMDRLKLGGMSPTLEGRSAYFAGQGAGPDTARAKALGEMSSGGTSEPVRFVGDGGENQALQAEARADGQSLQGRSIGVRAGAAALEGLKVGTQGVAAAALRAVGDEETAQAIERSAIRGKVKVDSINELTAMRQRAQEEGTVYGNDGFWENMAVGGVASAAQNAPQIAAGMALTALTKNPAAGTRLAMGLMTSQAFGDSYVEGRMKQLSPGQAASRAGIMAGFEYLGERFGLVPQAMKAVRGKASDVPLDELPAFLEKYVAALEKRGVLSPAAANLARGQLGEQFGEQITTAGQYWVDGTPLGLDQPVSLAGYFEAARDTAVQTLIATGVLQSGGAAGSALQGRARRPEEAGQPAPSAAPQQQGAQPMPQAQPVQQQARATELDQGGMPPAAQPQAPRPVAPEPAAPQIAQIPQGSIADAAEQMAGGPAALAPQHDPRAEEPDTAPAADPLMDAAVSFVRQAGTGSVDKLANADASVNQVDAAANEAATSPTNDLPEPTEAQKEAGNYKKGHIYLQGLDIAIENPRGSTRSGVSPDGDAWQTTMQHHYGYIKGTVGADQDHIDTFIGENPDSQRVFVIDQIDPRTGKFDEHKVVLGAESAEQAREIYLSNYQDGWQGLGAMTEMPIDGFRAWAKEGPRRKPLGDLTATKASNEQNAPQAPAPASQGEVAQEAADPRGTGAPASGQDAGVPRAGAAADKLETARLTAAARRGRAQFQLDPENDTLLQALAKMGGLRRDVVAREFGLKPEELKHTVSTGKLKAYPFRKNGGMDMDEAITALSEAGYFDGVRDDDLRRELESAIYDELGGSPRRTTVGTMRQAADTYNENLQTQAESADLDAEAQAEADAEREAIMAEAGITAEDMDAHPIEALEIEAQAQDIAAGMRALGFTEEEIADELARQQGSPDQGAEGNRAQDPELAPREAQAPPRAGEPEARPAGRARSDTGAASRDAGRRQDGPEEGLTLEAQTEQDLREKADREDAATKKADADRKAEQDRLRKEDEQRDAKARADATVDDFQLGQTADQQMSGMGDLFAEAAAPKVEVSANKVFTEDAAARARELLRKKLGQLNSGIDPEIMQAGITLAGYHIEKGARTFAAYARAMLADLGDTVKPYLRSWYMGVKYDPRAAQFDGMSSAAEVESADIDAIAQQTEGQNDVPDPGNDLEPDRGDAAGGERVLAQPDGDGSGPTDRGAEQARGRTGGEGRGPARDEGIPDGGAVAARNRSDQPVRPGRGRSGSEDVPARADLDQRGGGYGDGGVPVETVSADAARRLAADGLAQGLAKQRQRQAPTSVQLADLDNIRDTLPILLPGQQEDVQKAEQRFAQEDGYGILFTNGTGTGKTYTGLGIIKRYALQGKTDTLVVAPSDKVIDDWIQSGKNLGLELTQLASTQYAGKGITITTFANLGDNLVLGDRKWDLVVVDEAHYLMSAEDGKTTRSLETVRALTMHMDGVSKLASMRNRDLVAKVKDLRDKITSLDTIMGSDDLTFEVRSAYQKERDGLEAKLKPLSEKLAEANQAVREEVFTRQGAQRARAVFLSATPWAYVPTVDWANGYLFQYDEGKRDESRDFRGYNEGSNREQFFMQHFGYRMRYNRLTRPDSKVDTGLMERQFNSWLRSRGVLSARKLEVAADYDRRFVLVDSAIGAKIDEALNWVSDMAHGSKEEGRAPHKGFQLLADTLNEQFDYLSRRYLLEAIKAEESIPVVRQHLAKGRKVVVFHDFKKGGGFNPFVIKRMPDSASEPATRAMFDEARNQFNKQFSDLVDYPFAAMKSPIEAYKEAFPDVLLFNGDVSSKDRRAAVAKFQSDDTGPVVILVQSDAGKEGISLHDTTGKYQRALLNLGQPTKPTTAIQQEGRIYRTGQVTDAILRYFNTGTAWERYAFAHKIAERASTAENLGMGDEARALKDAFIAAFEESDTYDAGHEGEGKGGKDRDRQASQATTEFDRAVSFYYGTQKKNARTKAKEGADYFATPEPLGLKMVEWANPHPGDDMLEPSGGHGAIARWFPENTNRTAVEPSMELRSRLAMVFGGGRIVPGTFEDHHVVNKYDAIIMNPPFGVGGKTAVEHLDKAASHLRDGGRIVALIPTGPAADKRFDKWFYEEASKPARPLFTDERLGEIYEGDILSGSRAVDGKKIVVAHVDKHSDGRVTVRQKGQPVKSGTWLNFIEGVSPGPRAVSFKPADGLTMVADIKLPRVAFERAGTNVAARVVVLEKAREGEVAPAPRSRDYSEYDDINRFFEAIRDVELPKRAKPAPSLEELVNAEPEQGAASRSASPAREDRQAAKMAKAEATGKGATRAADLGLEVVTHVTGKGKQLRGVVMEGITQAQAKEVDAYTFKKDGGWFIRAEHMDALLEKFPQLASDGPRFSGFRADAPAIAVRQPVGSDALRKLIAKHVKEWKAVGVEAIAQIDSWRELPEEILKAAESIGLSVSKIEGVMHAGRVYMVRSAITSLDQAERILFHEVQGHMGLRGAIGGQPAATLDALWEKMNGLAGVEKLARKLKAEPGVTVWQRLQPYVRGTEFADQQERRQIIMEELIAYAAQANDTSVSTTFKSYLSDLKAAVVRTLKRLGLDTLAARMERAGAELDVLALVRDARNAIVTGQTRDGRPFVFSVGNRLLTDDSDGASFSVSPTNQAGLFGGNAPNGYDLPEFGRTAKFIEAVQNRYNRWKQAIDAVRKQGGTVTEVNDFYQAEERYWGIVGAQLDDFKGDVDAFVKSVQADGLELDDVALYAYALHAPERNARIAEINPKFPDGGSGMTDAQAAQVLDKAKADGLDQKLSKHAATLTQWTAGTRKVLLDNGLITPEEHKAWEDGYSHYVPLRGRIGEEGGRRGTGSGFDVRGKESFRAMGRRTQAQDIVEYILQDRAKALIRAGKNEVLRRFARFVLDNPDRQLWEINAVKRERKVVQTPSGEQLVVERSQLNTDRDDTVALKDGGQTIYITVRDQVLLQQLKNLHDEAKLPVIVEALHFVNRLLSRMYTSLNPVFTVLNGARDVLAGSVNMMGVAGPKGAASLLGNLGAAYREAYQAEVKGTPSASYDEYRRTGGKTGFMDFKDIEGYSEDLARIASESASWGSVLAEPDAWKKSRAAWRRMRGTARKLIERIEAYNGAVENATRFAAFKAARDQGKSVAEAANVAKNITVNFNRRGSMTPVLSSFFLFFNPAVQGTSRMVEALGSPDVQKALGLGMASVFALALANAAVGGDDDDDGMAYWDKIPDQVKDRNLIIMLPPGVDAGESVGKQGRYIKVPMPYGYNTFATLANTVADVLRNQMDPARGVSPTKGLARVAGSFIGSWFPVSDVAPSLENPRAIPLVFVPDALDPIVEPALNINSFGRKLYPEGMGQDRLPDSEKVFGAQKNTWTHNAARWINEATGGSQYHEGLVSVTPATVGNIVRGYGGGVATFITSIADTLVTQGIARDRVEWWRAPFVKQLYGEVGVLESQALAYERLQQIEEVAEPARRAVKAGDREAFNAIRDEFGTIAKLGPVAQSARDRLTLIRKNETRVIESTSMTTAEKNLSLRQWQAEREQVYAKVNTAYNKALAADAGQ